MNKLKVLIAVDSFKGSATSNEAGEYIKKGILKVNNDIDVYKMIIADGGEGTLEAIASENKGEFREIEVKGPLSKKIKAKYYIMNNEIAIIEAAEIIGINLLESSELNPYYTNTYGIGQVIKEILDLNIRKIYIGIGGSSTNDGGAGMLNYLGVKFYDNNKKELLPIPKELEKLYDVDISNIDKRIYETEIIVLSDVSNPLCGINGASYIYAPQKGAKEEDLHKLDKILENYGNIIDEKICKKNINLAGSGASGGLGYALISLLNASFTQGIDKIMELIKIEDKIKNIDLVITGEGRIDNQSIFGKAPIGVAKLSKKYNKPVVAISGSTALNLDNIYENGIDLVLDIINEPMSLDFAIENVEKLLEFAGEKAIRAFYFGK